MARAIITYGSVEVWHVPYTHRAAIESWQGSYKSKVRTLLSPLRMYWESSASMARAIPTPRSA
jgi:hypothetical protein